MSNNTRTFENGAHRNNDAGKPKMSLIPHEAFQRVMDRFRAGADVFGPNNWQNGMPLTELYDSANRHLQGWFSGDKSEDHMAAAVWNILCAMWMEKNKPEFDDR
jgi:hypothetical protein